MLAPLLWLALLAAPATTAPATAAPADGAPDPCRAARAPLPDVPELSAASRAAVDAYRAAWRRACAPAARPADLASLLGDAEALVDDVATSPGAHRIASAARAGGAPWPLPAITAEGVPLRVDWASFAAVAELGSADDARFWRGAAQVAGPTGEPAWLGERLPDSTDRCLRLGELAWRDLADALDAMESTGSEPYVRHARRLREALREQLAGVAAGAPACACVRGDPAAGLDALASPAQRIGPPARRALAKAAGEARVALASGQARVRFLRDAAGAPAAGCGAGP